MREIEVKGAVSDVELPRRRLMDAGATLSFVGRTADTRYDTPAHALRLRDEVLRVRRQQGEGVDRVQLEHKGAASYEGGYKVREEIGVAVSDDKTLHLLLSNLGYVVTREIEREIVVLAFRGATVRFETYPRMDCLVEVEGTPENIEQAIAAMGLPRAMFSTDRLADFAMRFEARTGTRAALCARELAGDFRYSGADA